VKAVLAHTAVRVEVTKPHGCSVKWIEKKAEVKQFNARWENTPVTLEMIDVAGVAKLARNDTQNIAS